MRPLPLEDQALLARFRAGDRAAKWEVYCAYVHIIDALLKRGFVTKSGKRVTALRSRSDREEVLQEVFVRAFEDKARLAYDGERDYANYLQNIARNIVADRHRSRMRERVVALRSSEPDLIEELLEADTPEPPAHGWLEPRAFEIARQYIATLVEPLKSIHEARYGEDTSTRKTAKQLGFSHSKLRKLEDRLRRGLLDLLEEAGIRLSVVDVAPEPEPSDG